LRYICGEHEFGGFPWWLLRNTTDIKFRQMNDGANNLVHSYTL